MVSSVHRRKHWEVEKKDLKIFTYLLLFSPPGIRKRFWNSGHVYVYMDPSLAPEDLTYFIRILYLRIYPSWARQLWKWRPKEKNGEPLKNVSNSFDQISAVYGDHQLIQNYTGGTFRKKTAHTLWAQMIIQCVHVLFCIISDQQWSTKQRQISFPR
jgi:hypothetical protein